MISKTMYRKRGDKKALDYTHISNIFKIKSLNGMLKYKVKMFFYYSFFDPW